MKLISFAVISLLAITVSAHPGLGTSATNDAPQCDKDVIMQKIQELTAAHKTQQELITKLEEPGKAEREEQEIRSVMKTIEKELERTDLPERERPGLEKHYADAVKDWEKAKSALVAKKEELKHATQGYNCMWVKLDILEETLALKTEQDAKSKDKTEVSPGSNPHRDILQKQIDEAFQDTADLSAADNNIKEGISKLDDVRKRTKDSKKKLDKTWEKFVSPSSKLAIEVLFTKDRRFHTKEFQMDFGWPSQNSVALEVYRSVRQMFSK